jgi:peptidyl-tRNA hydrolase, PTH1 family
MDILQRIFGQPSELPPENGGLFLLVGLGNHGREYRHTRHNIGFMVLDKLAEAHGTSFTQMKHKALVTEIRLGQTKLVLAKPQTYMNKSGEAVSPLLNFYKLPVERLLVIYDDLDLPLGTVRLREKGSAGGHNGMKSVIGQIGQLFPRLRLGIGRPPGQLPVHAYVLQEFGKDELPLVQEVLDTAVSAITTFTQEGLTLAMSRYNGKLNE